MMPLVISTMPTLDMAWKVCLTEPGVWRDPHTYLSIPLKKAAVSQQIAQPCQIVAYVSVVNGIEYLRNGPHFPSSPSNLLDQPGGSHFETPPQKAVARP
jgi:hypothetical protein